MSSKNPRKRKGMKRSTCEVKEGKIIRLELSRKKKKEVGGCKATPLLGTRCEIQHSQQLKIQRFVCRKGGEGTEAPHHMAGKQCTHPKT